MSTTNDLLQPKVATATGESLPAVQSSLDTRIAVLEERTAPKPKSVLDRVKDWGGLASLVLALVYSFPLGLWDRFIVEEKKRVAAQLAELRGVVDQSTVIMTDGARALAATQDPFLYDTIGRAINTRLFVLMTKHRAEFEKNKEAFTAPELLVVGYNFLATGQADAAAIFFDTAERKAGSDLQSRVEALRQRGKLLFMQGPQQDRRAARTLFQTALRELEKTRSYQTMMAHASLTSEWALFELMDGDWACGRQKLALAQAALTQLAPFMNDQGNFAKLVSQRTSALQRQPNQPEVGCS
jgi:hypothetical protein